MILAKKILFPFLFLIYEDEQFSYYKIIYRNISGPNNFFTKNIFLNQICLSQKKFYDQIFFMTNGDVRD